MNEKSLIFLTFMIRVAVVSVGLATLSIPLQVGSFLSVQQSTNSVGNVFFIFFFEKLFWTAKDFAEV